MALLDRLTVLDRIQNPASNFNIQFTMMKLGDFRFALGKGAYTKLSQNREWKWQSHYPIASKPIVQWGGYGDRTIELDGTIFPGILGSAADIEQMVKQAADPNPLLMVSGLGRVLGYWRITKCTESHELLTVDSTPMRLTFGLSLKYHGDASGWSPMAQLPTSRNDLERALF